MPLLYFCLFSSGINKRAKLCYLGEILFSELDPEELWWYNSSTVPVIDLFLQGCPPLLRHIDIQLQSYPCINVLDLQCTWDWWVQIVRCSIYRFSLYMTKLLTVTNFPYFSCRVKLIAPKDPPSLWSERERSTTSNHFYRSTARLSCTKAPGMCPCQQNM